MELQDFFHGTESAPTTVAPVIPVKALNPGQIGGVGGFNGDKFAGGFGHIEEIPFVDYWTLRRRSSQLFRENIYARGIIRRLITNEINTGLSPEAVPDESILGVSEDTLDDWAEKVESRFAIWANDAQLCDWRKRSTFGALQREIRREALIDGDVLVTLRPSPVTKLPQVQLFRGDVVRTPVDEPRKGNTIVHGVEIDRHDRHVAFWVVQKDGSHKRLPAFGERSGRRIAWLVYGTDKRLDEVRGQPLLAIVLQSLKEIDKYRDAVQRKAVVNSILALFIKKTQREMGTKPLSGGAQRKDSTTVTDGDGTQRTWNQVGHVPGLVLEELGYGEEPVGFGSQGIDLAYGPFEQSIIQAVAWCLEIPPEILQLSFSNNYSASQAAINEFKIAINKTWGNFGDTVCAPIYNEWLLSEVLTQKIAAPGFLEAWRNPLLYDIYGAWVATLWYGSIKPSTDMLKQSRGSKLLVSEGWSTNAREARCLTGTKFSQNIRRLRRENEQKVAAARPFAEFEQEFGPTVAASALAKTEPETLLQLVEETVEEALENVAT